MWCRTEVNLVSHNSQRLYTMFGTYASRRVVFPAITEMHDTDPGNFRRVAAAWASRSRKVLACDAHSQHLRRKHPSKRHCNATHHTALPSRVLTRRTPSTAIDDTTTTRQHHHTPPQRTNTPRTTMNHPAEVERPWPNSTACAMPLDHGRE